MRRNLLRGGGDMEPKLCDYCKRRVVMGVMFGITINEQKYRVCGWECEKKLRAEKGKRHEEG